MNNLRIFLLLPLIVMVWSCEEDNDNDPEPVNEEEVITTVKVVFTPTDGTGDDVFIFNDPDGPGGEDPQIVNDTLSANTTFDARVFFLNQSVTPTDTINSEIWEEGDEHQVFWMFDPDLGISWSYTDADINSNPVGLETQVVTDTTGSTEMKIVLRHRPDKSGPDVAQGDITSAGGETDVEVTFDVLIE